MSEAKIDQVKVDAILLQLEHLQLDDRDLEIQRSYESIEGGYGNVSVSKLNGDLVAVKSLRLHGSGLDRTRLACRLARELVVWAPMNHPNILGLRGFTFSPDLCVAQLIAPYQTRGHIGDYLKSQNPNNTERLRLASDTAQGLHYLHSNSICHGDLKPSNILVNEEREAVLCDFGLARAISDPEATSGLTTTRYLRGPVRYFSPELLNDEEPAPCQSLGSDVWAWACVLLEIVTDLPPHASVPSDREPALLGRLIRGILPADLEKTALIPADIQTLLGKCWALQVKKRPSMATCLGDLLKVTRSALQRQTIDDLRNPSDPLTTHLLDTVPDFTRLPLNVQIRHFPVLQLSEQHRVTRGQLYDVPLRHGENQGISFLHIFNQHTQQYLASISYGPPEPRPQQLWVIDLIVGEHNIPSEEDDGPVTVSVGSVSSGECSSVRMAKEDAAKKQLRRLGYSFN